ncbi:MAG: molecular chaperone DnaJ [Alphaproteobacteria bacterium]|nr:MAG: molecular chaperone DnaJ [Alphaproteobacteria bacterium]
MATAFLIGLVALLVLVLLLMLFERADPARLARALVWLAVLLVVLGAGALIASGRLVQSLPAIVSALLIFWQRGALQRLTRKGLKRAGAGSRRESRVETDWLVMSLDLATGRLDGTVRRGRFAGRRLESLSNEECLALYRELAADEESRRLLAAYLDRRMPGWRAHGTESDDERQEESASPPGQGMTREQALRILGLAEGASRAEILTAHRRLMQKLHPDHGGSDYLAAQINEARKVLLEGD